MNFLFDDKSQSPNYMEKKRKKTSYKKEDNSNPQIKRPKKISERYLYNSGLAYLQRFPSSSANFRTVMIRKINRSCKHHEDQSLEECVELLDKTVEKFIELGLLNDAEYLRGMVISLRRRGQSARQIEMKLKQKGMDSNIIIEELRSHDESEYRDEYNGDLHAALTFARKKRIGPYDVTERYEFEKALAIMARAGYSFDVAKKTISIKPEELDDYLTDLQ